MNGLSLSIYWECHHPNLTFIFFRGVGQPPTRYGNMISYRKMRSFFDDFDHHPKAADLRAVKLLRSLQRAEGEAEPEILGVFCHPFPNLGLLYSYYIAMPKTIEQRFQEIID